MRNAAVFVLLSMLHAGLHAAAVHAEEPALPQLRIGRAGHAFDHLNGFSEQAEAAAASGTTILYATGLGGAGYAGLPPESELNAVLESTTKYNRDAKRHGIELSLGYLCATSIVKLDTFDDNWPGELRQQLKTPPAAWRQQDQNGEPLPSWYGGDYNPACMNNPDWRRYEEFMVRQQLETGHDGIFFDNPTVHPQGCYCEHCMTRFAEFVKDTIPTANQNQTEAGLRQLAQAHPQEFLRFRSTIGRDFLAHIRRFARTINPNALITCNNSLNLPEVLYSQARNYGYNIFELSQAEDLVVVEDMATQPRTEPGGRTFEYGPTYKQLHAISHGKPVVAVTIAGGDYHTPPNLVRLAMAEAAANGASYLSWPTWPEAQRPRMISEIRPQADLLRECEPLLNDAHLRADVVLFLPFRRWLETDKCTASELAAALSRENLQFRVMSEANFELVPLSKNGSILLVESLNVLTPAERAVVERFHKDDGVVIAADDGDWINRVRSQLQHPSLKIEGPPTLRAVVQDQPHRTIVHLLNLNIEKRSSLEDKITPATNTKLSVRVPFANIRDVTIRTADKEASTGPVKFSPRHEDGSTYVDVVVPRLDISAILTIEG